MRNQTNCRSFKSFKRQRHCQQCPLCPSRCCREAYAVGNALPGATASAVSCAERCAAVLINQRHPHIIPRKVPKRVRRQCGQRDKQATSESRLNRIYDIIVSGPRCIPHFSPIPRRIAHSDADRSPDIEMCWLSRVAPGCDGPVGDAITARFSRWGWSNGLPLQSP